MANFPHDCTSPDIKGSHLEFLVKEIYLFIFPRNINTVFFLNVIGFGDYFFVTSDSSFSFDFYRKTKMWS